MGDVGLGVMEPEVMEEFDRTLARLGRREALRLGVEALEAFGERLRGWGLVM